MTLHSDVETAQPIVPAVLPRRVRKPLRERVIRRHIEKQKLFNLDETYWGYVISPDKREMRFVDVLVGSSWLAGTALMMAAVGMWVLPGSVATGAAIGMKVGLSIFFACIGAMCMNWSGRSGPIAYEVDTRLGELRKVAHSRVGRPTLLARFGFDSIGGVHIDRTDGKEAVLKLRTGNTARMIEIIRGGEAELLALRDRLGRDMMVRSNRPLKITDHNLEGGLEEFRRSRPYQA